MCFDCLLLLFVSCCLFESKGVKKNQRLFTGFLKSIPSGSHLYAMPCKASNTLNFPVPLWFQIDYMNKHFFVEQQHSPLLLGILCLPSLLLQPPKEEDRQFLHYEHYTLNTVYHTLHTVHTTCRVPKIFLWSGPKMFQNQIVRESVNSFCLVFATKD